tara:strand:- start:1310 stop:1768 length:459 start_codon:yes stop_codon:yes gene_type:complete
MKVNIQYLEHYQGEPLRYESSGASGFDIRAAIEEPYELYPSRSVLIPAGFKIAIPNGFELQIRPRSGLALKHRVSVLNSPGTIDSDYRGEVKILLHMRHSNVAVADNKAFMINPGDRIAQGIIAPVYQAVFYAIDDLSDTTRGEGGFGSTGV